MWADVLFNSQWRRFCKSTWRADRPHPTHATDPASYDNRVAHARTSPKRRAGMPYVTPRPAPRLRNWSRGRRRARNVAGGLGIACICKRGWRFAGKRRRQSPGRTASSSDCTCVLAVDVGRHSLPVPLSQRPLAILPLQGRPAAPRLSAPGL
jgi:hypothetical protein